MTKRAPADLIGRWVWHPSDPFHKGRWHIRGFVDDQIIGRYWRRSKGRWEYESLHLAIMNIVHPGWLDKSFKSKVET